MLEENGGEEGKALVQAFRDTDTLTVCAGRQCRSKNDQITITIDDGNANATYGANGRNTFALGADMLKNSNETDKLVHAGQFGHEIVHLEQNYGPIDLITGTGTGSLYGEIEAYDVQSRIYKSMGLARSDHGTVKYAADVASYKGKSPKQILESDWANAPGQYDNMPLTTNESRTRDKWFLRKYKSWFDQ